MQTPIARARSRIAVGALSVLLLAGCSGQAPEDPSLEAVPSTLAARPTPRAQPDAELEVGPPTRFLNGYAESSADAVWQRSMDLVRDWMLDPKLVQAHSVKKDELSGLLPELTGEAEAKWRAAIRKAVPLWMSPDPHLRAMAKAQLQVQQLVLWNLHLPGNRGWDNPMFAPVRVTNGQVYGNSDMVVMFQLHTAWRWRGGGMKYEVPYDSFVVLSWRRVDGEWKVATAERTWKIGKERLVGPPAAVASSKAAAAEARRTAKPTPSSRPSASPTVINSAP